MKRYLLIIFSLSLCSKLLSQNIVSNPNFSIGNTHPKTENQLDFAQHWTNPTRGTPDLFCEEANKRDVGIPENFQGNQLPKEGKNYAGIIAFSDDDYKKYSEYLQGELTQPLTAGKTYQISFWVSLSENSARAVTGLGACLVKNKIQTDHNHFLSLKPAVFSNELIKDSTNWVEISGTYVAKGNEKFILIGLFTKNKWKAKKIIAPNTTDTRRAYYYISAVSVEEVFNNTYSVPKKGIR